MRQEAFGYWKALPSKIGATALGLSGLAGTLNPKGVNSWVSWLMTPQQTQFWGVVGIAAFFAYWVVWFLLKPPATSIATSSNTVTSTGAGSPAIGTVNGNVTIGAPPPPSPEKPYVPNYDNLDGLTRALSPRPPMEIHPNTIRALEGLPPLEGDFTLKQLGTMLASRAASAPNDASGKKEFVRRINLEIADKVGQHQLCVWARRGNFRMESVSQHKLTTAIFDFQNNSLTYQPRDAVYPVPLDDVLFNRDEIRRVWPDNGSAPSPRPRPVYRRVRVHRARD